MSANYSDSHCLICRNGETTAGSTTVTLERGSTTIVFKKVPAQVCATCGEVSLDEKTSERLLAEAADAAAAGVEVEVRAFAA